MEQLIQALESPLLNLPASSETPVAISEEALQQTIHPTNTLQVVLPSGETHIDRSAKKIVAGREARGHDRLEVALQKLVLEPRGGLTALCQSERGHGAHARRPDGRADDGVPGRVAADDGRDRGRDVGREGPKKMDLATRVQDYYTRSAPPAGTPEATSRRSCSFPTANRARSSRGW